MKRRYVVKIEYEVTFDRSEANPGDATQFLRDEIESGFHHEGFSTRLGGMFFASRGKPTVKVVTK
jgi:hypothetical protein